MERKKTLGIRVLTSFGAERKKDRFFVSFIVDQGINSGTFLSNREIEKGLKELESRAGRIIGREFGRINYSVDEKTKTATMVSFHPIDLSVKTFAGKNIADLLENRARFFLRKAFPQIKLIKGWDTSPDRARQKKLRKRRPTETMDEARTALRRSIGEKRIKLRKTRPK
ncbi:MAG: hypothetical protein ABH986_03090 [archaeon]